MEKSPDAFRTISEVADWLGVPTHVLRFWESRFPQVKPVKRAGGRRYYRPADMLLLGGIKRLLHDVGMTIRGVQKMLREDGIRHVSSFSQPLDAMAPMRDVTPGQDEVAPSPMAVDVEPEPLDNVVPMGAPEAEAEETPAEPAPLAATEPAGTAPPGDAPEPDLAGEPQPATAGEPDQAKPDLAADAAGALQPTPAEAPDLLDEEKIPELSFLRRTPAPPDAAGDAAPEPDLFTSRRAPEPAETQPAEAEAPPPPRIPETPGVPAVDAADDDPATPALPGIAARLMAGQIRPDHAAIARAVADLRDLRARL